MRSEFLMMNVMQGSLGGKKVTTVSKELTASMFGSEDKGWRFL